VSSRDEWLGDYIFVGEIDSERERERERERELEREES
jgi:hypothetical protein